MPALDLSATEIAIAIAITALGTLVQGTIGFGLGLLAAPVLVALDPVFVPGPILTIAVWLTLMGALRERGAIARADVAPVFIGRVPGTVTGAAMLAVLPQSGLVIAVGVLVLLAVAMSVSGLDPRLDRRTLVTAGVLSGFMSTVSSVGGPPLAIVYQHADSARLRGTLAAHFVLGSALSLLALFAAGRYGSAELAASALLAPGVVAGYVASSRAIRTFDAAWSRPAVLGLSALAGAAIVVRELF